MVLVDHLQKMNKRCKNLKKQEIGDIFVSNMTWLMEILKIELEDQHLI